MSKELNMDLPLGDRAASSKMLVIRYNGETKIIPDTKRAREWCERGNATLLLEGTTSEGPLTAHLVVVGSNTNVIHSCHHIGSYRERYAHVFSDERLFMEVSDAPITCCCRKLASEFPEHRTLVVCKRPWDEAMRETWRRATW